MTDDFPVSGKQWRLAQADPMRALQVKQEIESESFMAERLALLMAQRGVSPEDAHAFLYPNLENTPPQPYLLQDMEAAATRLADAIMNGEKVAVLGDYDVDGATSSALVRRFFRAQGMEIARHIPDRVTEGYGPSQHGIEHLAKKGTQLLVTVDCGTTAQEVLAQAVQFGMDVVIGDHHKPKPGEKLPEVTAVVNPNREDDTSGYNGLAAVGVTWLMLLAVNQKLEERGWYLEHPEKRVDLHGFLDIVALGTIADVMPLTGLNRAFVAEGLKVMAGRHNPGLNALFDIYKVEGEPTVEQIAFYIAPNINAGGRLKAMAGDGSYYGTDLLSTDDQADAEDYARRLFELNERRKLMQKYAEEEAFARADEILARNPNTAVLVVAGEWHEGIVGIVAGRLKEHYDRPAVAIDLNSGKGSARSVPHADIGDKLLRAVQKGLLKRGGGHLMAGGLQIDPTPANIEELSRFLNRSLVYGVKKFWDDLHIPVSMLMDIDTCGVECMREIERLGPFGQGNPAPVFVLRDVRLKEYSYFGKMREHIELSLVPGDTDPATYTGEVHKVIAYRAKGTALENALYDAMVHGYMVQVAITAALRHWQGRDSVELLLQDVFVGPLEKALEQESRAYLRIEERQERQAARRRAG